MSRFYRCLDCGKEFDLDYSDNKDLKTEEDVIKYKGSINIPEKINICLECLNTIEKSLETSNDTKKKNTIFNFGENVINKLKDDMRKDGNPTKEEEEKITEEINELKKTAEINEKELNDLLKDLEKVEKDETIFCNEFRDLENKLYFSEKDLAKLGDLKSDYENKTKYLSNYNIFNELFQISVDEKYGSINECKFIDPSISSNYDGINAGWGYIILLTKLLSVKYSFESNNYELVPEGNFSRIKEKKNNGEEHEFGISDINRTRDKFNKAMSLYLYYLQEFLDFLDKNGKIKNNPQEIFLIKENKINNYSIEISNKEKFEDWYMCMKLLLNILKFLIMQLLNEEYNSIKDY